MTTKKAIPNYAKSRKMIKRITSLIWENSKLKQENRRLKEEITSLTDDLRRDQLTRLWNRLGLHHQWDNSPKRVKAVLVLDVDHFKMVNDTYGHHVGDIALATIANHIRSAAIGARTGGDEFIALVHSDPEETAERIRSLVNQPTVINGHEVCLSVSIGVYLVQTDDQLAESIRRADVAAYLSKSRGRNLVTVWSEKGNEDHTNRDRRNARKR